MLNWLIENWALIVVLVCMVFLTVNSVKNFSDKPTDEQIEQIRKWLLIAVTECEAQLGSKTGRLKLSMCYDMFVKALPSLAAIVPFELFSDLVDEVLDEMEIILKNQPEVLQKVAQGAQD